MWNSLRRLHSGLSCFVLGRQVASLPILSARNHPVSAQLLIKPVEGLRLGVKVYGLDFECCLSLRTVRNKYTDLTTSALSPHPLPRTQQIWLQSEEIRRRLRLVHRDTASAPTRPNIPGARRLVQLRLLLREYAANLQNSNLLSDLW